MRREPQTILADLGRAFPRGRPDAAGFQLYLLHLADVPPDALEAAVSMLIRTGEFFPTIRAIREAATEHVLDLPTDVEALDQITRRSDWARQPSASRGDPPIVHPLARQAVDLVGGYYAFRSTDNAGVIRSQFLRVYNGLREREVRTTLIGLPPGPEQRAIGGPTSRPPDPRVS